MIEGTALILLVEDNMMDVELTLDAFREAHFTNEIKVVNDGEEALAYLTGKGPYADRQLYPLPDLILLDLNLPKVSGIEVLKSVKQIEKVKRIPVIVLTSSRDEGDRAMTYDQGVNSYLVKPIDFEGFCEVVAKITDYWFSLNLPPPADE